MTLACHEGKKNNKMSAPKKPELTKSKSIFYKVGEKKIPPGLRNNSNENSQHSTTKRSAYAIRSEKDLVSYITNVHLKIFLWKNPKAFILKLPFLSITSEKQKSVRHCPPPWRHRVKAVEALVLNYYIIKGIIEQGTK